MTTKTDTQSINELEKAYGPEQLCTVSVEESDLIYKILELEQRNDIELQNIRDAAVMFYGQKARFGNAAVPTEKYVMAMDAMSAVCAIIDREKLKRGLSV